MGKVTDETTNQSAVDNVGQRSSFGKFIAVGIATAAACIAPAAYGQTPTPPTVVRNPITVLSDIQESNSEAGTVTARGNVFVDYPSRNLEATSAQAQYFSNARRLVLAGDVLVLQEGNSLRAEVVTYYVDEGRMVALPQPNRQVESIYLIPEGPAQGAAPAPIDESLINGTPDGALIAPADPIESVPPANGIDSFDQNQGPFDFDQ
ncbi:MAG: LptA/OstA family protein [Cyanophyceae cyanobacterium]